ncbi:MAG: hypothetical protein Fur0025_06630 [Oscillatoriaceae cyanobacterium]
MTQGASYKDEVIARITLIVEKLIREDSLFQGLDKNETIEILAPLL